MKKVVSVVGVRPEYIKVAAVAPHLAKRVEHIIVNSGQHYDFNLAKVFLGELLDKDPDFNLAVGSGTHAAVTAKIIIRCEKTFQRIKPDLVIVFGDSNTTLGAALAAAKLKKPIAHIEAGMRSYDRSMPEEINRIMVDHVSSIFLCSSKTGLENLASEGVVKNVYNTGDVMMDVFKEVKFNFSIVKELGLRVKEYYFATIHREENTIDGKRLAKIFRALDVLNLPVVFPMHPRTRKALRLLGLKLKNIKIVKPLKFSDVLALEKEAIAIITDSGGIQKEAYWLKIPCLTVRDTTEWVETVDYGWNRLVLGELPILGKLARSFKEPKMHPDFYGQGKAGLAVAEKIFKFLR